MLAACVLLPAAALAAYFANPFGVASLDPRERALGFGLYRIPSESMAPTLQPGRVLIVRAGVAATRDLPRGALVTFAPPHHPDQRWIKRLIAFPGETIELRAGQLLIDGRVVPEPYIVRRNATMPYSRDFGPRTVPAGQVFLLGDNRDNSEDSRFWGPARADTLHGRLLR